MVGLAGLLMLGLGIWVMRVANETTTVSMASVRGEACPKVPSLGNGAANGDDDDAVPPPSMKLDESLDGSIGDSPSPASAAGPSDPPAGTAAADDRPAGTTAGTGASGKAADEPEADVAHMVAHQHRPRADRAGNDESSGKGAAGSNEPRRV